MDSEAQPGKRRDHANAEAVQRPSQQWLATAIVGIGGAVFLAFFTHWYEAVVQVGQAQNHLTSTTVTPLALTPFFLLLLVLAGLRRCRPRWRLEPAALSTILGLWLLTGAVCYHSLVWGATHSLGVARNPRFENPSMQRVGFTEMLPQALVLEPEAAKSFATGIADGTAHIPVADLPLAPWRLPLAFSLALCLTIVAFSVSLARMVHRQWADNELLSFPIAEYAAALLPRSTDQPLPEVMYRRPFWIAVGLMLGVYLINGLHDWFPLMIEVPLNWRQTDLMRNFDFISSYCGREAYSLFRGVGYPFVIALAVLLPLEISFSCWGGYVLMIFATGAVFLSTGVVIGGTETGFIKTGMYVAMSAGILYIGRREYLNIVRYAFSAKPAADVELHAAVRACRVFLAAGVVLAALLTSAGLDWLLAIALTCSFAMVLLIIARLTAEVGVPWLVSINGMARFMPLKFLGAAAIGPHGLAVMTVIGGILDLTTSNTVIAQQTTVNRLCAATPARDRRRDLLIYGGLALAIVAAMFTHLWQGYSFGTGSNPLDRTIRDGMHQASAQIEKLELAAGGDLVEAAGLAKLGLIQAEPHFWSFCLLGAVIIGVCTALRLRFAWWPLHPLPLLLFNTWGMSRLWFSFMMGWLIKLVILRVFGGRAFGRCKPFLFGIITGQLLAAMIWIAVACIYYLITASKPPFVSVLLP